MFLEVCSISALSCSYDALEFFSTDRQTDRPTDRQTDRPTDLGIEAPSPELKNKHLKSIFMVVVVFLNDTDFEGKEKTEHIWGLFWWRTLVPIIENEEKSMLIKKQKELLIKEFKDNLNKLILFCYHWNFSGLISFSYCANICYLFYLFPVILA